MNKEFCELCWGTGEVDAINGQRMPCPKCSDSRSMAEIEITSQNPLFGKLQNSFWSTDRIIFPINGEDVPVLVTDFQIFFYYDIVKAYVKIVPLPICK